MIGLSKKQEIQLVSFGSIFPVPSACFYFYFDKLLAVRLCTNYVVEKEKKQDIEETNIGLNRMQS